MRIVLTTCFSCLLFLSTIAQQRAEIGDLLKQLALNDTISDVAIDRVGDFYVVTNNGQIQRFDKDGKLSLLYKAENRPTLFDPRDGARLFVYYRKEQRYQFLTPSFDPITSYKIDPAFAIQPWLICPSGEYKLWILDQVDQSLKKIDVKASEVEVEVRVDSTVIGSPAAFTTIREYQNFLFMLNPSRGILVFNALGQKIKSIGTPPVKNFNFLGEELYYLQGDTIHFFNLFTTATRQMRIDAGYSNVLLTDERMILFAPRSIAIYAFRP